jgi:predicted nucleic acid-binding protein
VGLILDTSVLIDAERRRLNIHLMLEALPLDGFEGVSVSAVTVMELAEGIVGANSEAVRRIRQKFLDNLRASVPVIAVNDVIAVRAGLLNGALRKTGVTIGVADAMIAASALGIGGKVATFNVRHFKAVPGLEVVEL